MNCKQSHKASVLHLPQMEDARGVLTYLEAGTHFLFPITSLCWTYKTPRVYREWHETLKDQQKTIISLTGSLDIVLKNEKYTLSEIYEAASIPQLNKWSIENISSDAIYLMMDSDLLVKEDSLSTSESGSISTVNDCLTLNFPTHEEEPSKTIAKVGQDIPFFIRRVFYTYNVPHGAERGVHAHKNCHTILIAIKGSLEVEIDDGLSKEVKTLNEPTQGLYIPPGIWSTQRNYSEDAICLVLASHKYDTEEYVSCYETFKEYKRNANRSIF